jgi:hypothetical protein
VNGKNCVIVRWSGASNRKEKITHNDSGDFQADYYSFALFAALRETYSFSAEIFFQGV